ncbi:MAG TPA: hypothetical protein VFY28_02590 [Candidatus Paceibacterota bacterium]|nr:hypothetical protein [Candidatus Paceibacterota bacterium]
MPDRTISILSYAASGLVIVYVGLVIATVSFAAWRTDLAEAVRDTENRVSVLEREYYDTVERIGRTDPASLGLVKPRAVTYAAMAVPAGLSRR